MIARRIFKIEVNLLLDIFDFEEFESGCKEEGISKIRAGSCTLGTKVGISHGQVNRASAAVSA